MPLLLLLLLTACTRYPPPVAVSFPDDPRVLHGEWVMDLREDVEISSHLYLPHHDLLLAWGWRGESSRGWQHTSDLEWTEIDADVFQDLQASAYDSVLDAFVTFRLGSSEGTASITTLPDGTRTRVSIDLPADVIPRASAVGSGRLFLYGHKVDSGPRLYWWDAVTGDAGGSISVHSAQEGMRRSQNGRILSFWSFRHGIVQVVDTAAPEKTKSFRLGICGTLNLAEASSDGRWFALNECGGRISVVDLHAATPVRAATGLSGAGRARFADDSAELVFANESGVIRSFNPVSREIQTLYTVPEADWRSDNFYQDPSLNRASDRLTVLSGDGHILTMEVGTGAVTRLPELAVGTVRLQLSASDLQNHHYSSYDITGTAHWPVELGNEQELAVTGRVNSDGLHKYRPGLESQALPPPTTEIYGEFTGGDEEYTFGFSSTDAHAGTYEGSFTLRVSHLDRGRYYAATLRRP